MPIETSVTCDACGADLSCTTNCDGYRLELRVKRLPACGSFVTAMYVVPPYGGRTHVFCGERCLQQWASKDKQ